MAEPQDPPALPQRVSDHLANERTFLAWVRTALGIIGLGFVVSRFALYLRSLAAGGADLPPTSSRSALLGAVMVGTGAAINLFALMRFLSNRRAIDSGAFRSSQWSEILFALLICVVGVVMMAFLLTSSR